MHLNTFINTIFLCVLNTLCMVTGIFLNSLVTVSLWRSRQLRKKLCYFTILVLSCFDLVAVATNHPVQIIATLLWSKNMYHVEIENVRRYTHILLTGFSLFALLTLNIERFLALTCPFFHQTAVTKRRLIIFQVISIILTVATLPFQYFQAQTIGNMLIAAFLLLIFSTFIFLNYKMFVIAKSKRVVPTGIATTNHEERKEGMKKFKTISTCWLVVGCFFVCFFPGIIISLWGFTSKVAWNDTHVVLFGIWSNTLGTMSSTVNCLIFFWRNSILRREGMKIAKCLWAERP